MRTSLASTSPGEGFAQSNSRTAPRHSPVPKSHCVLPPLNDPCRKCKRSLSGAASLTSNQLGGWEDSVEGPGTKRGSPVAMTKYGNPKWENPQVKRSIRFEQLRRSWTNQAVETLQEPTAEAKPPKPGGWYCMMARLTSRALGTSSLPSWGRVTAGRGPVPFTEYSCWCSVGHHQSHG